MARSRSPALFRAHQRAAVEIRPVPFVPFRSLQNLDLEKLARAPRAVVELGQFESACCRRTARAVIERGLVTGVQIDARPDAAATRPRPDLARLLERARARIGARKDGAARLPMSVATFFGGATSRDAIKVETRFWTRTVMCLDVCITILGATFCQTCCTVIEPNGTVGHVCGGWLAPH